jgi:hypothetical protein
MRILSSSKPSAAAGAAVAFLTALAFAAPGRAQPGDRQLLASGGGDPYVMIVLDTSGSMNWGTACDADDRATDPPRCTHDCAEPNCPRPMNGDDPDSKIYQAKKVLYEVLVDETGVRWGFNTMNQDELAVGVKHWFYKVTAVSGYSGIEIPAVGWGEVFGAQTGGSGNTAFNMTCDRNGGGNSTANGDELYETGCYLNDDDAPDIDTTDVWTLEKLRRLPKGGAIDSPASTFYFMRDRVGSTIVYYRFTYASPIVDYSATTTFDVNVTVESCDDPDSAETGCDNPWTFLGTRTVTYSRDVTWDDPTTDEEVQVADPHYGEFIWWEGTVSTDADLSKDAYFGGRTDGEPELPGVGTYASGVFADKTCRGWEPNGNEWGQRDPVSVPSETDPHTDGATSYNLKWPSTHFTFTPTDPADQWMFEFGDMIPLDWDDDNLEEVLTRLNPKHPVVDAESYAQSPFFADSYGAGESFLRLQTEDDGTTAAVDEAIRPLVAHGSTPLAAFFSMFRNWYSGCGDPGQCDDSLTGWSDIAAVNDPNFACSPKYVLMITDGAETCDGAPQENSEDYYEDEIEEFPDGFSKTADQCRYRASLRAQEDINNIVIGFGTENQAKLQCANTPVFFADNAQELKELLEQLIGEIREQAAAFASAAVPTVQANILDKVYLSSFIPLNDAPVWPGRLDSFLKPLPLGEDNLPDRSTLCSDTRKFECFAWDAGDSQIAWDGEAGYAPDRLLLQAPLGSEISDYAGAGIFDNTSLQIGLGEDERRVYFGLPDSATQSNRRMTFDFPADPGDADLGGTEDVEPDDLTNYENALEITPAATVPERREEVADIVAYNLREKQALIDFICTDGDPAKFGRSCDADADCDCDVGDTTCTDLGNTAVCTNDAKIQYVLGDIFHSNPLILNPPANFEYFTKDLYWPVDETDSTAGSGLCGDSAVQTVLRGSPISYSWYSNKNLCRRVAAFVGTNEGQLHAFDAGLFGADATGLAVECQLWFANDANDPDLSDEGEDTSNRVHGEYDFGTGREIFSFIPDAMMPFIKEIEDLAGGCTAGLASLIGSICDTDDDCGESAVGADDGVCTPGSGLTDQWGVDGTPVAADVFIDPFVASGGAPVCQERVWRTLLLTNYRSGGDSDHPSPGIFALDITQPDTFDDENVPEPLAGTESYVPSCSAGGADCDDFCAPGDTDCEALAYPALRWEFRDLDADGANLSATPANVDECDNLGEAADDDCNGEADLAETWSRPFVARLSICTADCATADPELEDRYVAIFGGGVAEFPTHSASDVTGNWLYMVDVETGEAIYKRGGEASGSFASTSPIVGSVPADITGVDDDSDGRVDTLYFGTTAGFVYKVALGDGPFELDGDGLIADPAGTPGAYDPFQVFSTDGKPIYLEIGAVYVPRQRANAILFGTGDRADLWDADSNFEGRFYSLIDPDWAETDNDSVLDTDRNSTTYTGPLTEADFPAVDPDSGAVTDYLYDSGGWYFTLDPSERLITEAFTLTGITFFTIFDPLILESAEGFCARSGESKIFVVNTVTTEGYQVATGSTVRTRYVTAPTFTTQPFVEYSATKNPGAELSSANTADEWTEALEAINAQLRLLLPSDCKFANYTQDIKTVRSDTGIVFIAPVPMCIEPHNWKEF